MNFCAKCGKRLVPHAGEKKVMFCSKCKLKIENLDTIEKDKIKSKLLRSKNDHKEGVVVLDKKVTKLKTLPTVDILCEKCNSKKAETWKVDLGSEDNSQAIFYRCLSCGHTWRITE